MTIRELAIDAIQVQDACNLSGVIHGFSRAITALRQCEPDHDTEYYNKHPICQLWADKIAHLTGTQCFGSPDPIPAAYNACHALISGEKT